MVRAASSRGRFTGPLSIEGLEARLAMSANLGLTASGGLRHLDWNGRQVDAIGDAWVARLADRTAAVDALGLPTTWAARSLGEGFFSITAPGAASTDVVSWAGRTRGVAAVEPDFAINPTALPSDPAFSRLWGLRNAGQTGGVVGADIRAETAWNTTIGSRSVVVAVIDTGVDYTHQDLAANIWTNPREVAGDGIDNDGNGLVDDVRGWDFANRDADPMDDNGHGTHVAGTIGAVGNNGVGVTGVNWQVSIMPLKFLTASGSGSTSNAIAAVNYVTRMRREFGVNIVASNNSWGGGGSSTLLRDAIDNGGRAGILFVAAAGNDGANTDIAPHYPSSYPGSSIISVAATTRDNTLASFSNYGLTSVDVAAPGSGIYSTVPGNAYATYSGTSMATPHVTGTVALLAAAYPTANLAQIRSAILTGTTPVAGLAGRVATGGLLNAAGALDRLGSLVRSGTTPAVDPAPVTPPAPVTAPVATPTSDAGDTLAAALAVNGTSRLSGTIGDGASGSRDVDLYRVTLRAGQSFVIDVDARSLATPSRLDSFVRLFDTSGRELARNDDAQGSFDSYLSFTARTAGTYFVGITGYRNSTYNAVTGRNAMSGSTGAYEVVLSFGQTPSSNAVRMLGMRDAAPQQAGLSSAAFAAFAGAADTTPAARPAARRR